MKAMKSKNAGRDKSTWVAAGLGLAVLLGVNDAQAQVKDDKKERQAKPAARPNQQRPLQPSENWSIRERQDQPRQNQNRRPQAPQAERRREMNPQGTKPQNAKVPGPNLGQGLKNPGPQNSQPGTQSGAVPERRSSPVMKPVQPTEERKSGGVIERKGPSGHLAETVKVDQKTGEERFQRLAPSGRIESEAIRKADGTIRKVYYDLGGAVKKEEVVRKDGSKQVTDHSIGRDGNFRAKETITYGVGQRAVSKTVERNVTINTTGNNAVVKRHYDRGRYGFVYRPIYFVRPRLFVSWCDPYWYHPVGYWIHHPFRYSWGWERHGWYHRYHGGYWNTYSVYPTPSYWVTDYLLAAYVADHYAGTMSAAQALEEARLARDEAEKARQAAQDSSDEAEIAEASAAAAQAELRARNAEQAAAKTERQLAHADRTSTGAPIDNETKERLRKQIEQTLAEQKKLAEQSEKTGQPILPDFAQVLADSNHIYPVSKTMSVVLAKDDAPAGILSEGDLLKVEPGQENILNGADENTEVLMRVMTSKGDENEVPAGTLIKVFLKDLQEFDSEFRARLDEALVAAESNKDAFKRGLIAPTAR
jgi:hypothetical protein